MNNYQLTIDNAQLLEGYQQTEVGVIPEDWKVISVQTAYGRKIYLKTK